MKILIIEDNSLKSDEIQNLIHALLSGLDVEIQLAESINGAIVALSRNAFDLVIADLVLPQFDSQSDTCDATEQWCSYISSEVSIRLSTWIVMSSYSKVASDARTIFARHGVAVIEYAPDGHWKNILQNRVLEHYINRPMDFIIVCALEKERIGFESCDGIILGKYEIIAGVDCQEILLGELRGKLIVLPEVGLVSAAICTTKAASLFKPKLVAMSGICAGMVGETQLGDIVAPDIAWNYQTGKIRDGELIPEIDQTPVPPNTKRILHLLSKDEISSMLRSGLLHKELRGRVINTNAMVSGSSVVADENQAAKVALQSRKIAGLDMEVSAVFSAAHEFYNGGGAFFAAKVVVDMASSTKDDRYHEYGCALSARFVLKVIEQSEW